MKKYFIGIGVLVLASVVYFTGLYTYFIRTEVQEELPQASSNAPAQTMLSGKFVEVDLIHKGSGDAKLIQVDGKYILRLENFNVTSGPDLYIYLAKTGQPTGDIESLGDFIDLGLLKGTSGNQNYEIAGNITGYKTAVVWCKQYGILFTYAVME
ncbi:MAG: DM13 domain-containing protein [Candidatus Yanofskybacteria bacterium]|nr:DM13 domain-containing protein [Candidatus Yanofskybacteria bacterium]